MLHTMHDSELIRCYILDGAGRGVASGGKRVTECIGPRGLGGPRSPGHREHRDIPFE